MTLLPYENLTYKTKLKEEEVLRRIADFIEPVNYFRFNVFAKNHTKPYEGTLTGKSFFMQRIIRGRNSFLPQIFGEVSRDINGTSIHVKMRIHMAVLIFISLWCGFAIFAFFAFLEDSRSEPEFTPFLLIPAGMLLFMYILSMAAFKYESSRSKTDLQKLFEAEISEL